LNHTLGSLQEYYVKEFESSDLPPSLLASQQPSSPAPPSTPSATSPTDNAAAINTLSIQVISALSQDDIINPTQQTITHAQLTAHCHPDLRQAIEAAAVDFSVNDLAPTSTIPPPQDFYITLNTSRQTQHNIETERPIDPNVVSENDILLQAEQSHTLALQKSNPLHLPGFPYPTLNIEDTEPSRGAWKFHSAQHLATTSLTISNPITHSISSPSFWALFEKEIDSTLDEIIHQHDQTATKHPIFSP
jgi:hypothetical protein